MVWSLMRDVRSGLLFFFKQKTAYEMRISDWSSDVCSSDLQRAHRLLDQGRRPVQRLPVVRGQQRMAQRLRRMRSNQVVDLLDVAQRLAHLGAAEVEHAVVQPEAREHLAARSEERRVGNECVRTCRSRGSPYP